MKTVLIILGTIVLASLSWCSIGLMKQSNKIKELERENTQLKQQIIKANTEIIMANEILNNTDSTCIFIYKNPSKFRRK